MRARQQGGERNDVRPAFSRIRESGKDSGLKEGRRRPKDGQSAAPAAPRLMVTVTNGVRLPALSHAPATLGFDSAAAHPYA